MKVLLLYDYPPPPGGLATQGDLLYRGLLEKGVDAQAAHFESPLEKEWYYRWFNPDIVLGVGYWGHTPHIVQHPQNFGQLAVPWLVADGYIANYQDILNNLPLILVTSNWVKDVYMRDGIRGDSIEVLPVGCNTEKFIPRPKDDPGVVAIRQMLGLSPEDVFILTVGGDAASKGAQEVMMALASLSAQSDLPPWKYVCKVWPQPRTTRQNRIDVTLAHQLGIAENVIFLTDRVSRNFMPFLVAACDIYAAPSRLEGFGMIQVEAGACGKPVIGIEAMAMLDTLVQGETAFLAKVALENRVSQVDVGAEAGFQEGRRIVFDPPRIADYRADIEDLAKYLSLMMRDPGLRSVMGEAGRQRAVSRYDYRTVAGQFVEIIVNRLGIQ